jgi:hypothetical protein
MANYTMPGGTMKSPQSIDKPDHQTDMRLKSLTPEQVDRVNELLMSIGDYGEIHLIIQRGELRYINKVESYKVWNERPK